MKKILVIDDEKHIRETLGELLQFYGFDSSMASDGVEAIELMSKNKPDIVLSDVMMPTLNGFDMVKLMRTNPDLASIPVIFLTAKGGKDDLRTGMGLGADDFITKPFQIDDVLNSINTRLEKIDLLRKENLEQQVKKRTKKLELEKQQVDERNQEMTESMSYARFIQNSVLHDNDTFYSHFSKCFLINMPKDILGGDFFWVKKINDDVFLASVDCTGHGVPGALMSIVGHICFDKAILERNHRNPTDIVKDIESTLSHFLSKHDERLVDDGMDIGLCKINMKTQTLTFCGASQPLLYATHKDNPILTKPEFETALKIIEGDTCLVNIKGANSLGSVIGKSIKLVSHTIELSKGDRIYMFSDGFKDQLGETEDRRFSSSRFRKLLATVQSKKLGEQKSLITDSLNDWKGALEQTDDIMIVGVEF